MTQGAWWLALVVIASAWAGCIGGADETVDPTGQDAPTIDESTLIAFEKIHTPEEINTLLDGYDELQGVEVETIGTSFEGREIRMATVGEGDFELWIVGRQHGNEPTGGEAILLAIEALADPDKTPPASAPPIVQALHEHRETLLDRITFLFVPVANPDGAAAYQRETALGQDPNRDHFLFTQPASDALREAFWAHRPDGCLDLHNEGLGETDFDAFGPIGPMLEAEPEALMLRDADLAVREVDAAGGNAGSMNENYRAPAPADDQPNPTAVHPGTHDMFCTTRGAPGWTPEGAIPAGENGIDTLPFAWSTRTHLVTIAASAFHWAGAYDATEPHLTKHEGELGPSVTKTVELTDETDARFQAVWRQTTTAGDHNPAPVMFTVTTPEGTTIDGRGPAPEQWTSTVTLEEAPAGTYELSLTGASAGSYELRTYLTPAGSPLVTVERNATGLVVDASQTAPDTVHVTVTDVADRIPLSDAKRGPDAVDQLNGTVDERTLIEHRAILEPGASTWFPAPDGWTEAGPYRFTATSQGSLHTGVEDAFNPKPD